MIDNTALQACPFCGGEAEEKRETANRLLNPTAYYYARCKSCGATGKADLVPKHAIAAWNRRAEPANEPLTCEGCMDYDLIDTEDGCYIRRDECKRLIRTTDYYRRKPEGGHA